MSEEKIIAFSYCKEKSMKTAIKGLVAWLSMIRPQQVNAGFLLHQFGFSLICCEEMKFNIFLLRGKRHK
jgi:hypothetical protein